MKSRMLGRIEQRYRELAKPGQALDAEQMRRLKSLPLLHLQKLVDTLESEVVGKPTHPLWPANFITDVIFLSGTDDD